jgi:hypothetical protein
MKAIKEKTNEKAEDPDFSLEKAPKRNNYRRISAKVLIWLLRQRKRSATCTARKA